jgi:hypothetical protein
MVFRRGALRMGYRISGSAPDHLLAEIHVVTIPEKLVAFILPPPVRPLHPSAGGGPQLDIGALHAQVGGEPVEERLELVATIPADDADPERADALPGIGHCCGIFLPSIR